jgi:carboxyl-terminal processing protease
LLKNRQFLIVLISSIIFTAFISIFITVYAFTGVNHMGKFVKAREVLTSRYYKNVDENKLMEGAISGMANSLGDKYTAYYTKDQWSAIELDLGGSYVGIGITVKVGEDGLVAVASFFDDSSAKSEGMEVGDKIVKVDDLDVRKIKSDTVISMIRGKENTKVKLTIIRESDGSTRNFNVVREKIKVDNVTSRVVSEDIGYINIKKFDVEVARYFNESLDKLLKAGIKGLVIDVRDDPGGYYEQVVAIADRLLPKGIIVYTEDKNKVKDTKYSDKTELGLPLVVLINGNSASASEILAGAIKDNKKGKLIGTKSYGKGLVQTSITFKDGSGLKYTIQRYFTPSGVCIQGTGIQPDEEIKLDEKYAGVPISQIPIEDDLQLKKAIEDVKVEIR